MGRRPSPVVVEFFDRGAKLDDSSNRYQHTCRRCGELFPKGRSDALTSHLLRKCPHLTQEDRQWVFHQIQQVPERLSSNGIEPVKGLLPSTTQEDLPSELQVSNYQQQSALDTLAEVSRRHLDYSTHRGLVDVLNEHKSGEGITEQDLIAQLREHAELSNPVTTADSTAYHIHASVSQSHQAQQTSGLSLTTTSTIAVSPLVQAASAANQQLEQAQAERIDQIQCGSLLDPQLHNMGGPLRSTANAKVDSEADAMMWRPTSPFKPQQPVDSLSMPSSEAMTAYDLPRKTNKQKVRGHFDDTRRKEVQQIRKQGACIRCRMLKKPCSGETPCSTCKNVETARLWKGTCLRTKLADEFSLWSTKLFHARSEIETHAAVHGLQQHALPGRIEARLSTASDFCVTFATKAASPVEINSDLSDAAATNVHEDKYICLLEERDNMPDKLEAYANCIADDFVNEERSSFMRITLQRAQILIRREEAEEASKAIEHDIQSSPRSCYNSFNHLLKNVIQLWVLTRLLTTPDAHRVQLRYEPNRRSRSLPEVVAWDPAEQESPKSAFLPSSHSYRLIKSQLMAAMESGCSKLTKTVMNELERRLLRRQQVSRFATFLTAVILLNAIERMTGFYRSFETEEQQIEHDLLQHLPHGSEPESTKKNQRTMEAAWGNLSYRITDQPNFWPLNGSPSALWPQGPHFSDLLNMLLRVRALPPKTCNTPDGTLAAIQDFSLPVHVDRRPAKERVDEETKAAADWLESLQLSVAELVKNNDGVLPGRTDPLEDWDMKFVAKVLLPERM